MLKTKTNLIAASFMAVSALGVAHAAPVYATGFEAPAITVGAIAGRRGDQDVL